MGETMARDVPVSWFSSVDLPTLGRPMMATLISSGATSECFVFQARSRRRDLRCPRASANRAASSSRLRQSWLRADGFCWHSSARSRRRRSWGLPARTSSSSSATPSPCSAEIGSTSRMPSRRNSVGLRLQLAAISTLLTARNSGLPVRCSRRASSMSGAASSVRPSTTMTMASASSSATRAWRKISAGISSLSSGMMPPVSTTRKRRPRQLASP